jgi:hypothetical protein
MTEADWNSCADPGPMLNHVMRLYEDNRRFRLFAVACCREVWGLLRSKRSRAAVEAAERFADGQASRQEMLAAGKAADNALREVGEDFLYAAARYTAMGNAVSLMAHDTAWRVTRAVGKNEAHPVQVAILRCVFGNPFRPPLLLDPSVLAWRDSLVVRMAHAIYEERELPSGHLHPARLAVLADALEEAGCQDPELLGHLRSLGPHVRGCWPVDRILAKG